MLVPASDLQNLTSQLTYISEGFRSKKILITGSSGFIGSWLSQGLSHLSANLDLDLELIFLSRRIDNNFKRSLYDIGNKKNTFIESDLSSNNLLQLQASKNIDIVFHTATTVSQLNSQISDIDKGIKVSGTANLINAIKDSKKPPVLIHLSSGAVYGPHPDDPKLISENAEISKIEGLSSYGSIKRQIEELVNTASNAGMIIGSNPRLFSFFGPLLPLHTNFAIGNFVSKAIHGESIELTGNPYSSRSYLYISDLVRKLVLLSNRPTSNTIHIGSKNGINMLDLASTVKGVINKKVDINSMNLGVNANHYVPSVEKSNIYLDDYSEITLAEGLLVWKEWLLAKK